MADTAPATSTNADTKPATRAEIPEDWPDQIADRIVAGVETVRSKTTTPATTIGRAAVFGLLAGFLGLAALVLFVVALVRLNVYIPLHPHGRQVEVAYAILAAIFTLAGLFCWSKRTPKARK